DGFDNDCDGEIDESEGIMAAVCNPIHGADNNPCDECISNDEIKDYILKWKINSGNIKNFITGINIWKNGC
ncbi:hypothetical protein HN415_00045, partial [Candidatus Woesearchaeota archaeon]|nr:hypothetical protein [Candidatus Woesearchaeota archaeon]